MIWCLLSNNALGWTTSLEEAQNQVREILSLNPEDSPENYGITLHKENEVIEQPLG